MKIDTCDSIHRMAEVYLLCAEATHEMNRLFCQTNGDNTQTFWKDAPEWQKKSAVEGVKGAVLGNDPRESHEAWKALKISEGWVYGPEKNPEKKEHPCIVPMYEDLPLFQRLKDDLFLATARNMVENIISTRVVLGDKDAGGYLSASLTFADRPGDYTVRRIFPASERSLIASAVGGFLRLERMVLAGEEIEKTILARGKREVATWEHGSRQAAQVDGWTGSSL